jgi:hypothetical protein
MIMREPDNWSIFQKKVTYLLNKCQATHGRMKKKIIALQIYDYIMLNLNFLINHQLFAKTVLGKLNEFYRSRDFTTKECLKYRSAIISTIDSPLRHHLIF